MICSALFLAGLHFGGLDACQHGNIPIFEVKVHALVQPCFNETSIIINTQYLLKAAIATVGPQLLVYRGNLTVTDCRNVNNLEIAFGAPSK